MHYNELNDKLQEECGIFGIFSPNNKVAVNIYWGLYALQHRGQESAGMVISDGTKMNVQRGMGLVNEVFRDLSPTLDGHMGIGHVRYSTTGSSLPANTQPLLVDYYDGPISLAHNGNLTNAGELRRQLEQQGSIFQTSMDSEVVVHLIAKSSKDTIEERIIDSLTKVQGAYCLAIMTRDKLIAVRDQHGFRPLCLGKLNDNWVVSSESCAFDTIGATFVRDVEPGEMIVIDDSGLQSRRIAPAACQALCVFEYIYFARPDSVIDGQSVYEARREMGRQLANQRKLDGDIVISVPDSGTAAAMGYSAASGIPFAEGLIKNRYIGRTFIQPEQKTRDLSVRIKLNPVAAIVKDKRVIMVDDSIVRGTTSGKIVRMLKEAGAREVHMCSSSPPIVYPCHYGIDTSIRKDLIAAVKSIEEIREFIEADTLTYLSLDGLRQALDKIEPKRLCDACFTGHYPIELPGGCGEEGGAKFVFEQG